MARVKGLPQALSLAALTVGTLEVTGAATFAATVTATGQFLAGNGTVAAPGYAFAAYPDTGMWMSGSNLDIAVGGISRINIINDTNGVRFHGGYQIGWTPDSANANAVDAALARLGSASIRMGLVPSSAPIAQTFTIGEASRPGTDTNVGGANGTLRSGLGTGTGTPSTLIFEAPLVAASGSGAQTYGNCFTAKALNGGTIETAYAIVVGYVYSTGFLINGQGTGLEWGGADGVMKFRDNAGTSFGRLCFGGTTDAFPSLKRSGANLVARLADDSGPANFYAANVVASGYLLSNTLYDRNSVKILGDQGAAVADAAGGATVDAEARTAINTMLARLRAHGLIAT